MKLLNTLILALGLASASPAQDTYKAPSPSKPTPTPPVTNGHIPKGYKWHVTSWSAGCARHGCYYDFNVTGTADRGMPDFLAYCSGEDSGFFADCKLLKSGKRKDGPPSVAARLGHYDVEKADGKARLGVSLAFEERLSKDTLATWNFTGRYNATFNQFVAPLEEFYVTPNEVSGVA
ncbi:hypothetical protein K470DRAFT_107370 [Piedraia hortae CBS 480.64]|uniref:Uncharacterized protein n=1 Tax=Piedraia hortae CBS 480.64 TaxID=1314780 RepID=A0A6A7BV43_9PEZI|nr:hypothetical protein K470DRAFT_107370 [Piedraia hortae CBS 480.64]